MENVKEFYVLGKPIYTDIGKLRFLKVKEYPLLINYIGFLNLQKWEVVEWIKPYSKELSNVIKNLSFLQVINELDDLELNQKFQELFILCFNEDVFNKIKTNEEFEYYRNLIREVNCVKMEEKNPNPEIEKFNKMAKIYNQRKNGDLSFESMYTSVWVSLGFKPDNLTLYEFYSLFNRISQFKNHDVTTLYSTVSSEVKVETWYKHIDMFNVEKKETLNEFSNKAKKIMK